MSRIPPPPVPQRLRDMLKDYPEHIQRVQDRLIDMMVKPAESIPLFEQAIWGLDGVTGTFVSEARKELKTAQEGGDPSAIQQADEKLNLMYRVSSRNGGLRSSDELWEYCQAHQRNVS